MSARLFMHTLVLALLAAPGAQAQSTPAPPEEIAAMLQDIRGWRQIADYGATKIYFGGPHEGTAFKNLFLTGEANAQPQGDRVNPRAAPVWGKVHERQYDCAAKQTRVVRTLTLRVGSVDVDAAAKPWVPRAQIMSDDGIAAFKLACG